MVGIYPTKLPKSPQWLILSKRSHPSDYMVFPQSCIATLKQANIKITTLGYHIILSLSHHASQLKQRSSAALG